MHGVVFWEKNIITIIIIIIVIIIYYYIQVYIRRPSETPLFARISVHSISRSYLNNRSQIVLT
jgi:hypothetical protein